MSQLEQHVDALISDFNDWFQKQGNDPMVRSEVAITKTFLWYLVNERKLDPATLGLAPAASKET